MKIKVGLFVRKNASAILTGIGALGIVATAATASYDREKYEENLKKEAKEKGLIAVTELERGDRLKVLAKSYWRTAIVIGVTEAAVIFSNRLDAKKIAALAAAATFAEDKLRKYRDVIAEKLGSEEEKELYVESTKPEWHLRPYLPEGTEEAYFYDTFTEKFFRASPERVTHAIYHLNRNFRLRHYVLFSEFYDFIGLESNDLHKNVGWSEDFYYEEGFDPWIDIYTPEKTADNGVKYYEIRYDFEPSVKALDGWV